MNRQLNSQGGFEKTPSKNRLQSDRVYMLVLLTLTLTLTHPVGGMEDYVWLGWGLCRALRFVSFREERRASEQVAGPGQCFLNWGEDKLLGECTEHVSKKCLHTSRLTACLHPEVEIRERAGADVHAQTNAHKHKCKFCVEICKYT